MKHLVLHYPSNNPYAYSALVLLHRSYASAEKRRWSRFRRKFITETLKREGKLTCVYCLRDDLVVSGPRKKLATLDHIVPRESNGKDVDTNVVICCDSCNRKKANKPHDLFIKSKYLVEKIKRNETTRHQ